MDGLCQTADRPHCHPTDNRRSSSVPASNHDRTRSRGAREHRPPARAGGLGRAGPGRDEPLRRSRCGRARVPARAGARDRRLPALREPEGGRGRRGEAGGHDADGRRGADAQVRRRPPGHRPRPPPPAAVPTRAPASRRGSPTCSTPSRGRAGCSPSIARRRSRCGPRARRAWRSRPSRGRGPAVGPYVLVWFLSAGGRTCIERVASSTSGLYTLSVSKVAALPVPLPPEGERQRIVAEVDRRLSILQAVDENINRQFLRAAKVRQAVLTRAFQGRLVPQDPSDEPASVLLERIRRGRGRGTAAAPKARGRSAGRQVPAGGGSR